MLEIVIAVDDYLTHSITDMYILTSLTKKMFQQLCKQVIPLIKHASVHLED